MKSKRGFILDLDGTLYRFRGGDGTFRSSDFCADLKNNMARFLAERLGVSEAEAINQRDRIEDLYNGQFSLGVEKELGIDRYDWFANTWNLDPARYIDVPDNRLAESLSPLTGRAVLLTAAPAIWTQAVLAYLGVSKVFGDKVVTGEPNVRKPNPGTFCQAAALLERKCSEVVSIGDQNETDILPAKQLGMTTVLVGSGSGDAHYRAIDIYEAIRIAEEM